MAHASLADERTGTPVISWKAAPAIAVGLIAATCGSSRWRLGCEIGCEFVGTIRAWLRVDISGTSEGNGQHPRSTHTGRPWRVTRPSNRRRRIAVDRELGNETKQREPVNHLTDPRGTAAEARRSPRTDPGAAARRRPPPCLPARRAAKDTPNRSVLATPCQVLNPCFA